MGKIYGKIGANWKLEGPESPENPYPTSVVLLPETELFPDFSHGFFGSVTPSQHRALRNMWIPLVVTGPAELLEVAECSWQLSIWYDRPNHKWTAFFWLEGLRCSGTMSGTMEATCKNQRKREPLEKGVEFFSSCIENVTSESCPRQAYPVISKQEAGPLPLKHQFCGVPPNHQKSSVTFNWGLRNVF